MPGLTCCEGQSPDRSSRTCPALFPRRVSSVPLIPVPPPLTYPPTDDPFCSIVTTLLRSWPSAVHPPAQAYAQGAVTGVVGSPPAIAGVRTRRRHRRRRQCTRDRRRAHSAVHLVAGSTTSSFFTRIARTILARPLVMTSVERFSCQKLVKTCMHSHPGILHRLFGSIRSVSDNASCGVEHHGVNARMPTYAYAQQVRTSSPSFPTRWLREFYTLH